MSEVSWRLKECVWEMTLACNLRCLHCGSAAGTVRGEELSTVEALSLVRDLSRLGCDGLTLSGGEPLLRHDWMEVADLAIEGGLELSLITNGLLVERYANEIERMGLRSIGFSVDGLERTHDRIRSMDGALARLLDGARALRARGMTYGAVTHINRLNLDELDSMHDMLVAEGFKGWQVQLTMPHGRAADAMREKVLAPGELVDLERRLLEIRNRTPMFFQAADNLGYMGRGEAALRAGTQRADKIFGGCRAGLSVVGITSDGSVRGCLSMTDQMNEGNLRHRSLGDVWNDPDSFAYNRRFELGDLKGECAGCAYGKICRGGCKSLALATCGDLHANRHCLHAVARSRPSSSAPGLVPGS